MLFVDFALICRRCVVGLCVVSCWFLWPVLVLLLFDVLSCVWCMIGILCWLLVCSPVFVLVFLLLCIVVLCRGFCAVALALCVCVFCLLLLHVPWRFGLSCGIGLFGSLSER